MKLYLDIPHEYPKSYEYEIEDEDVIKYLCSIIELNEEYIRKSFDSIKKIYMYKIESHFLPFAESEIEARFNHNEAIDAYENSKIKKVYNDNYQKSKILKKNAFDSKTIEETENSSNLKNLEAKRGTPFQSMALNYFKVCKDCEDRHPACHDHCVKYYKAKRDFALAKRKIENEKSIYTNSRIKVGQI